MDSNVQEGLHPRRRERGRSLPKSKNTTPIIFRKEAANEEEDVQFRRTLKLAVLHLRME